MHVFAAGGASEQALTGKDRVFDSKKLSGIARLDGAAFAVADTGDERVAAVADFESPRYLIAEEGGREGHVSSPAGLAASSRGRLYVADRGNRRISVFSRDGLFLFAFGDRGPEARAEPIRHSPGVHVSLLALDRLKDAATQAAEIARRQGKHGDAIGYLTQALKLKPASAEVNLAPGSAYYETSDYDRARAFLEKAALLDPRNARPYEVLGDMYRDTWIFR